MKLFIGTPAYDHTDPAYEHSLTNTEMLLDGFGVPYTYSQLVGDSYLPRARAQLASAFMDAAECTHFLAIDADMSWEPRQILRLIQANVDFAVAIAHTKQPRSRPAVQELAEPRRTDSAFRTIQACGFAFVLLRRNVLEKMSAAFPDRGFRSPETCGEDVPIFKWNSALWETIIRDGVYIEGDHAFCHLWRSTGGEIWADEQSAVTHWGRHGFGGQWQPAGAASCPLPALTVPPPAPDPATQPQTPVPGATPGPQMIDRRHEAVFTEDTL